MKNYVNISDSYKTFKGVEISKKDYVSLNNLFNKFLITLVIEGKDITLPQRMGRLFVKGSKQNMTIENGEVKGLAPDWRATRELWNRSEEAKKNRKIIYFLNNHTDGYRYKFFWSRKNAYIHNKELYIFKAMRFNKRALSKKIKEGFNYITQ